MSLEYKIRQFMTNNSMPSGITEKEPLAHPRNCKTECPYGYGRAFCFPCYAKIMSEYKTK